MAAVAFTISKPHSHICADQFDLNNNDNDTNDHCIAFSSAATSMPKTLGAATWMVAVDGSVVSHARARVVSRCQPAPLPPSSLLTHQRAVSRASSSLLPSHCRPSSAKKGEHEKEGGAAPSGSEEEEGEEVTNEDEEVGIEEDYTYMLNAALSDDEGDEEAGDECWHYMYVYSDSVEDYCSSKRESERGGAEHVGGEMHCHHNKSETINHRRNHAHACVHVSSVKAPRGNDHGHDESDNKGATAEHTCTCALTTVKFDDELELASLIAAVDDGDAGNVLLSSSASSSSSSSFSSSLCYVLGEEDENKGGGEGSSPLQREGGMGDGRFAFAPAIGTTRENEEGNENTEEEEESHRRTYSTYISRKLTYEPPANSCLLEEKEECCVLDGEEDLSPRIVYDTFNVEREALSSTTERQYMHVHHHNHHNQEGQATHHDYVHHHGDAKDDDECGGSGEDEALFLFDGMSVLACEDDAVSCGGNASDLEDEDGSEYDYYGHYKYTNHCFDAKAEEYNTYMYNVGHHHQHPHQHHYQYEYGGASQSIGHQLCHNSDHNLYYYNDHHNENAYSNNNTSSQLYPYPNPRQYQHYRYYSELEKEKEGKGVDKEEKRAPPHEENQSQNQSQKQGQEQRQQQHETNPKQQRRHALSKIEYCMRASGLSAEACRERFPYRTEARPFPPKVEPHHRPLFPRDVVTSTAVVKCCYHSQRPRKACEMGGARCFHAHDTDDTDTAVVAVIPPRCDDKDDNKPPSNANSNHDDNKLTKVGANNAGASLASATVTTWAAVVSRAAAARGTSTSTCTIDSTECSTRAAPSDGKNRSEFRSLTVNTKANEEPAEALTTGGERCTTAGSVKEEDDGKAPSVVDDNRATDRGGSHSKDETGANTNAISPPSSSSSYTRAELLNVPCQYGEDCRSAEHRAAAAAVGFSKAQRDAYIAYVRALQRYETTLVAFRKAVVAVRAETAELQVMDEARRAAEREREREAETTLENNADATIQSNKNKKKAAPLKKARRDDAEAEASQSYIYSYKQQYHHQSLQHHYHRGYTNFDLAPLMAAQPPCLHCGARTVRRGGASVSCPTGTGTSPPPSASAADFEQKEDEDKEGKDEEEEVEEEEQHALNVSPSSLSLSAVAASSASAAVQMAHFAVYIPNPNYAVDGRREVKQMGVRCVCAVCHKTFAFNDEASVVAYASGGGGADEFIPEEGGFGGGDEGPFVIPPAPAILSPTASAAVCPSASSSSFDISDDNDNGSGGNGSGSGGNNHTHTMYSRCDDEDSFGDQVSGDTCTTTCNIVGGSVCGKNKIIRVSAAPFDKLSRAYGTTVYAPPPARDARSFYSITMYGDLPW